MGKKAAAAAAPATSSVPSRESIELEDARATIERLNGEIGDYAAEADELRATLAECQDELAAARDAAEARGSSPGVHDSEPVFGGAESQNAELKRLRALVRTLESNESATIKTLRSKVNTLTESTVKANERLSKTEAARQTLVREHAQAVEVLRARGDTAKARVTELTNALAAERRRSHELGAQLELANETLARQENAALGKAARSALVASGQDPMTALRSAEAALESANARLYAAESRLLAHGLSTAPPPPPVMQPGAAPVRWLALTLGTLAIDAHAWETPLVGPALRVRLGDTREPQLSRALHGRRDRAFGQVMLFAEPFDAPLGDTALELELVDRGPDDESHELSPIATATLALGELALNSTEPVTLAFVAYGAARAGDGGAQLVAHIRLGTDEPPSAAELADATPAPERFAPERESGTSPRAGESLRVTVDVLETDALELDDPSGAQVELALGDAAWTTAPAVLDEANPDSWPVFNEQFETTLGAVSDDCELALSLHSAADDGHEARLVGSASLALGALAPDAPVDEWVELRDRRGRKVMGYVHVLVCAQAIAPSRRASTGSSRRSRPPSGTRLPRSSARSGEESAGGGGGGSDGGHSAATSTLAAAVAARTTPLAAGPSGSGGSPPKPDAQIAALQRELDALRAARAPSAVAEALAHSQAEVQAMRETLMRERAAAKGRAQALHKQLDSLRAELTSARAAAPAVAAAESKHVAALATLQSKLDTELLARRNNIKTQQTQREALAAANAEIEELKRQLVLAGGELAPSQTMRAGNSGGVGGPNGAPADALAATLEATSLLSPNKLPAAAFASTVKQPKDTTVLSAKFLSEKKKRAELEFALRDALKKLRDEQQAHAQLRASVGSGSGSGATRRRAPAELSPGQANRSGFDMSTYGGGLPSVMTGSPQVAFAPGTTTPLGWAGAPGGAPYGGVPSPYGVATPYGWTPGSGSGAGAGAGAGAGLGFTPSGAALIRSPYAPAEPAELAYQMSALAGEPYGTFSSPTHGYYG